MKVFSNTTPFIALAAIQRLARLPELFSQVHVTDEVAEECAAGGLIAVPPLRQFDWVVFVPTPAQAAPHILLELDRGEKATLLAAMAEKADLVLMDEQCHWGLARFSSSGRGVVHC